MTFSKRIVSMTILVAVLATSGIVFAGETGRKNTRNALGAATAVMIIKGNRTGAIVGAAGTYVAQRNLDKSIKARHRRAAYRSANRRTYISRAQRARNYRARQARIKHARQARAHQAWLLRQKNLSSAQR